MGQDFTSPKPRRCGGAVKTRNFPSADGEKELEQAGRSHRSAPFPPRIGAIPLSILFRQHACLVF